MSVVPRKRDAAMSGQEIARRGGLAADPKVQRREALEAIRLRALADVGRSADEAARLLELAAANPALKAGPLLEAYGQGAVGPIRSMAWWRRNGCRVRKGERAYLLSAFGNAFFGRNQVIGPDPGGIGTRETPPAAFPDIGEGHAMAILAARAGGRLRAVWSEPELFTDEEPVMLTAPMVDPIGSMEDLERALEAVRQYDATATGCLSCGDRGCVLCACAEDRVAVRGGGTVKPMPRKPKPKRIGRPPKKRPSRIASVSRGLDEAARLRAEADRLEAAAKAAISQGIAQAQADGHSLRDIGAAMGVSAARVDQLLKAGR